VILNTGIIYRIGHNRMYVALGRTLAEAGHTVFRFDMSGSVTATIAMMGWRHSRRTLPTSCHRLASSDSECSTSHSGRSMFRRGLCNTVCKFRLPCRRCCSDRSNLPTHGWSYFLRHLLRRRTWTNFLIGKGFFWRLLRRQFLRTIEIAVEDEGVRWQNPITSSQLLHAFQESTKVGIH
jgi:hypothetical protein